MILRIVSLWQQDRSTDSTLSRNYGISPALILLFWSDPMDNKVQTRWLTCIPLQISRIIAGFAKGQRNLDFIHTT